MKHSEWPAVVSKDKNSGRLLGHQHQHTQNPTQPLKQVEQQGVLQVADGL